MSFWGATLNAALATVSTNITLKNWGTINGNATALLALGGTVNGSLAIARTIDREWYAPKVTPTSCQTLEVASVSNTGRCIYREEWPEV